MTTIEAPINPGSYNTFCNNNGITDPAEGLALHSAALQEFAGALAVQQGITVEDLRTQPLTTISER